eukprot:509271_1
MDSETSYINMEVLHNNTSFKYSTPNGINGSTSDSKCFTTEFNASNTFITRLFGTETSAKITKFMFHRIVIAVLTFMSFLEIIWKCVSYLSDDPSNWYNIYRLFWNIIWMIWLIVALMTTNITGFTLSCKQFLFWYKMLLALKLAILYCALVWYINFWNKFNKNNQTWITVAGDISGEIAVICMVTACCVLDSFNMAKWIKIICMVLTSSWYSCLAILYTFGTPITDVSIINIKHFMSISLYHQYTNSIQVLSIFLWKQTIALILRPNKCVNISISPYIKWDTFDPSSSNLHWNEESEMKPTYIFIKSNTFLSLLLDTENAFKLKKLIYNRFIIILFVLMGFAFFIWDDIAYKTWDINYYTYQVVLFTLLLIWISCIVLTMNINAFLVSCKTFLFWFKNLLAFKLCVTYFILFKYLSFWGDENASDISFIGSMISETVSLLLVMICCALDSFDVSHRIKIICMVCVALWYSAQTIINSFEGSKVDNTVITIAPNVFFSVHDSYVSSMGVLAIFFWRQAIYLILTPNKCVNIELFPYITWN